MKRRRKGEGDRTGSGWAGHADVGVDEAFATCGDRRCLRGVDVVAGGEGAAAGGQAGLVGELLD